MTLSRQLVLLLVLLLLLVFAGTFYISVRNTQVFLGAQLESHAQDAATSLGLSISSHLAQGDTAAVTSMSNAIFDRGFYRHIQVQDVKGNVLVNLESPVKVEGVPQWFVSAFPLATPQGEATVMAGWSQAGRVLVQSHPGYAYRQLWDNLRETAGWFLLCAVWVLTMGLMLLRWVLRPLQQVAWQAESICNREFPVQERLPRTLDLRRIVEAMNRMTQKVQAMLSDLEGLVGRLHQQAYLNPVTGLINKRRFADMVGEHIRSEEVFSKGALCLIQLKDFKGYNDRHGYQAGDELLQEVARMLERQAHGMAGCTVAHLTGADFALLTEECTPEEAVRFGEQLAGQLAGLYATGRPDSPDVGHVGVAYYDGHQSLKELLAQADMALRSAQGKEANGFYFALPDAAGRQTIRGAGEWREFIEQALEQDRIVLHFQPVVACPSRELLQREVLVRIVEPEGGLLTAGVFFPVAESVGLAAAIDRAVITKVLAEADSGIHSDARLTINLSPQTVLDPGFIAWLEPRLTEQPEAASRLIFEMSEYGAVAQLEHVRELIERVGRFGVQFSLDHFGRSFSSLAYLHSLKVHYLKVDGSYLQSLDRNRDHQFFIRALADIAHGLDIQVIAESVESEEVWKLLPALHLDAAQGYYIGRPAGAEG